MAQIATRSGYQHKAYRRRRMSQMSRPATLLSDAEMGVQHVHIAIVGTGFSGLGMAIKLKQQGYNDFVVLERAADIGGTWRDNTYPGCACDIPSHLYSFSFALNPHWSRMYPQQREIQSYLRHCARRFGIIPHIRWRSELLDATWNEEEQHWHLTTARGQFTATLLILGNGPLSEPSLPHIPGIERFKGALFHSAQWNHDYDLMGKRVAAIGTGASAIQFVPQIQPHVAQLKLFMRTPPWIMPRMDHPLPHWQRTLFHLVPLTQRLFRTRIYLEHEITALGMVYRTDILEKGSVIATRHLRRQITDPTLRAKLTPHYAMGCKRILVSDDFYPALVQPNVDIVTEPICEIREHSIVTADGEEHEIDTLICGTGFRVTQAQIPQHIHGHGGQSLAAAWQNGISAYLGTTVAGFPNLFLLIGPNTGLGHNSMVYMIESQFTYIMSCLSYMQRRRLRSIEVDADTQNIFNAELQQRMQKTVWTSGCKSWYLDAAGNNTTLWPGFTFEFRHRTRHFDAQNYHRFPQRQRATIQQSGD